MDDEREGAAIRGVVGEGLLQRGPSVSAVGAQGVKEGLHHDRFGSLALSVHEPIVSGRNWDLTIHDHRPLRDEEEEEDEFME